ncbi:MAG: acyl-CoA dehydrogenase family protein [Alphaproteobacteria bacterium]
MTEISKTLAETCDRLFSNLINNDVLRETELAVWPDPIWQQIEENGLTFAMVNENHGGSGIKWIDCFQIIYWSGYYSLPVPLVETMVSSWFLSQHNQAPPKGVITFFCDGKPLDLIESNNSYKISGIIERVPWGASADYVLAEAYNSNKQVYVLLDAKKSKIVKDKNISGESRDSMTFDKASPLTVIDISDAFRSNSLLVYAALARSVQMSGGISAILDNCISYSREREQFGQPIAKFQAIQHQLAILAAEAAAAKIASQIACRAADLIDVSSGLEFEVATAKIRAGESAGLAASIGHQVHGAIGFTDEYSLHYITRRLWSWRSEYGSESYWARRMGKEVIAGGADNLWADITARL